MISRRNFVAGSLATFLATTSKAKAEVFCSGFDYRGLQHCTAGLQLGPIKTAQQKCPNWCWAACIEAIFGMHGYHVDQRTIVQKLFGSLVCAPAAGPQIINTINGKWKDIDGNIFTAYAEPLVDLYFGVNNPFAAANVARELAEGKPLINGAVGHATVLTAMSYLRDQWGNGIPTQLVVRDPWPGNINKRLLTAQESSGTNFIAKVSVS